MIADAGFKVSDIFGGRGGKGRTVAAKYANPDDPSETWTGRGRKPRWLSAKLAGWRQDREIPDQIESTLSRAGAAASSSHGRTMGRSNPARSFGGAHRTVDAANAASTDCCR